MISVLKDWPVGMWWSRLCIGREAPCLSDENSAKLFRSSSNTEGEFLNSPIRIKESKKVTRRVEGTDTCMPSCPDIPIPISAAWIMLTSFAPSPERRVVVRSWSNFCAPPPTAKFHHMQIRLLSSPLCAGSFLKVRPTPGLLTSGFPATAKCHKPSGLNYKNVSQFRKLEVWNQGVDTVGSRPLSLAHRWLSLRSQGIFPVCLSVSRFPPFVRTPVTLD